MSSSNKELTVVQFDLVNSSKSFQDIYRTYNLGDETLRKFIQPLEDIIGTAFNQSIENREIQPEFTKIETPLADGYRLTFESVKNAYDFITIFCKMVDQRNTTPGIDQWCFRIGAATGNVDYNPERINQMIGNVFLVVKELETGAVPGWLFIDEMTYNALSQERQNKFSSQTFQNKHGQSKTAYGCPMLANYVESVESIRPVIWTESIRPVIWTDEKRKNLRELIQNTFTEQQLQDICIENSDTFPGNLYDLVEGNTYKSKLINLVRYLYQHDLINQFLEILGNENQNFGSQINRLFV